MKNLLTAKTFALAELLIRSGKPMSIKELSEKSGIERSACWRIVSDLCELGYLRKTSYRTVEPGLGMVFLGQASYSEAFFPHIVREKLLLAERELDVNTALAGIFNGKVVYFHRSGGETKTLHWPLHGSNIAVAILTSELGGAEAFAQLMRDAETAGYDAEQLAAVRAGLARRIAHVEKTGYALEETPHHYNISFPLGSGNSIFGLAFFFEKRPSRRPAELIAHCSLLRNELQRAAFA